MRFPMWEDSFSLVGKVFPNCQAHLRVTGGLTPTVRQHIIPSFGYLTAGRVPYLCHGIGN